MREGDNRGVRGAGLDPGVRSPARKEEVDAVEDEVSPDASTVRPVSIKISAKRLIFLRVM
jgi:hypothetical protein